MIISKEQIAQIAAGAGYKNVDQKAIDGRRKPGPGRKKKQQHLKKANKNPDGSFCLTELQALHHQIIRLKLTGMKHVDIAQSLGCTAVTVGYTVNSSLGKSKLAIMSGEKDSDAKDFRAEINQLLPDCVDAFADALKSDDMALRVKTAQIVAGQFGGQTTPTQVEQKHMHMHLSPEQIEDVKSRGLARAKQLNLDNGGDIIDQDADVA